MDTKIKKKYIRYLCRQLLSFAFDLKLDFIEKPIHRTFYPLINSFKYKYNIDQTKFTLGERMSV